MISTHLSHYFSMKPTLGKIRLLIADDQPLILRGMSMMLESEEDIEIVGLANDGVEVTNATSHRC